MVLILFTVLQLTKNMAVDIALENNLELKSKEVELAESKMGIDEAYANLYPKIDLSASYTYLSPIPVVKFQPDPSQPAMEISMSKSRNYSLGASLSQPIFTWGNLYRNVKISKLSYKITEVDLNRKKQIVIRNVRNSFDQYLLAKEYLELLRRTNLRLSKYHSSIKRRYEAGLVSKYDLIRTEAELAQNESQIIGAENNLLLAKDGLKVLINTDDEFEPIGEIEIIPFDVELDSAITWAVGRRAELENLITTKQIAEIGLKASTFSYLPTAFGAVNYSHDKPYQLEEEWGGSWVFTVGASWPIFSGFKTKTQVAKARLAIKKVELSQELLRSGIEMEVKTAYYQLNMAKAMIEAQLKMIEQARKTRDMIEIRYSRGLATALELLDGELVYSQARIGHLQAMIDYNQAYNNLILAVGKEE